MEKIAIAVPVHDWKNRWDEIRKIINFAESDERIEECVMVAEPGDEAIVPFRPKLRWFKNLQRKFVFRNKFTAIQKCSSKWVIILDSDNEIDKSYVDVLYSLNQWDVDTIYQPSYLIPAFDCRKFAGKVYSSADLKEHMKEPMFRVMLNAMNYFVNRETFLKANQAAFDDMSFEPHCADSLFVNYNMFKYGCKMNVVKRLEYKHKIHNTSYYKETAPRFGNLTGMMEAKLSQL